MGVGELTSFYVNHVCSRLTCRGDGYLCRTSGSNWTYQACIFIIVVDVVGGIIDRIRNGQGNPFSAYCNWRARRTGLGRNFKTRNNQYAYFVYSPLFVDKINVV